MAEDWGLIISFFIFCCFALWGYMDLRNRRNYPIRAEVASYQGKSSADKRTVILNDRLGFIDDGKGNKEWRLLKLKKTVQEFSYDYVYEKRIFMGLRIGKFAWINAVMGTDGEEFRPIKFDLEKGAYKPVFDGERGILAWRLTTDILERNTYRNWWKDNIMQLAGLGANILVIIMLFLCFLQLVDVSKNLENAASALSGLLPAKPTNSTNTLPNQGNIGANFIGGIPLGVTENK